MKILTGNDLFSGDVTWWTGHDWSRHVDHAVPLGDDAAAIVAREEAAQRVVSAYVIDATHDGTSVRPAHIKDRVRALGPTVRLDLSLHPDDPQAAAQIV
ncbi:DUF2849 domain-containing protein [Novosphingobium sp.]|uniref:DUF2849 domain-containing protein n=1 Tax=Novosphingobium sp. TaxID=1874826 RepID=UPI00333FD2B3